MPYDNWGVEREDGPHRTLQEAQKYQAGEAKRVRMLEGRGGNLENLEFHEDSPDRAPNKRHTRSADGGTSSPMSALLERRPVCPCRKSSGGRDAVNCLEVEDGGAAAQVEQVLA